MNEESNPTVETSHIFSCQSSLSSVYRPPPKESTPPFLALTAQPVAQTQVTTFQIHSVFKCRTGELTGISKPPCAHSHPPF